MPLTIIFPLSVRETAHNNGCGPFPQNGLESHAKQASPSPSQ